MNQYSETENTEALYGAYLWTPDPYNQPPYQHTHVASGSGGGESMYGFAAHQTGSGADLGNWDPYQTVGQMPICETPYAASALWEHQISWPGVPPADVTVLHGCPSDEVLQRYAHSAFLQPPTPQTMGTDLTDPASSGQLSTPLDRGYADQVSMMPPLDNPMGLPGTGVLVPPGMPIPWGLKRPQAGNFTGLDPSDQEANTTAVGDKRKSILKPRLDFSRVTRTYLEGRSYGPKTKFINISVNGEPVREGVQEGRLWGTESVTTTQSDNTVEGGSVTRQRVQGKSVKLSCKGAVCAGRSRESGSCSGLVYLAELLKSENSYCGVFTCFCDAHFNDKEYRWTLNCTSCKIMKETSPRRASHHGSQKGKVKSARCAEHAMRKSGQMARVKARQRKAREAMMELSLSRTTEQSLVRPPELTYEEVYVRELLQRTSPEVTTGSTLQ